MKKIIKLTEVQFDNVLKRKLEEQSDINERGRKGLWKSEWNEEDQMLAMYNSLYGIEELGINKEQTAEDVIGTSLASFNQQTSNFDFLSGKGGLDRPHEMQTAIYEKYKDTPKTEFKSICSDIVHKRYENPENSVVKKKLGQEIGSKRDEIQKTREDELRKRGINPDRASLISSRPKNIPDNEPDSLPQEQSTAKDEIRDFLKAMYDRARNINTKEDARGLAGDIEFIMDYIDNELTDKNMVSEITNLFREKTLLSESEAMKNIKRITEINKKINI
jgi:hypothetical protein